MQQNNLSSKELEQYNYHRSALIELCARVGGVLNEARNIQNRTEHYETPEAQLKADSYTLVLIGEFQSGKSTLFNYLCDGKELSPVGPSGGGVRTSGCKVTAHPLQDGESNRAVVYWRNKSQLLSALGGLLTVYFENPTSTSYLTEREIDLDKYEDRDKLAGFAWQELLENKKSRLLKDEELELLRFTLILCKFYDRFAQRCADSKIECNIEDAVRLASYPQDWCKKWQQIEEWEDKKLSSFSEDDVNFAFCAGVEYFLDSAVLRELGCSIIDCPGLFVSKWATEIVERCIKDADAILYMFAGTKVLTQGDLKALQATANMGGKHKIIFGANLRVARDQWNRILDNAIIPTLKNNGFENPEVHNFHSAIALRSREIMLCECECLPPMSEQAIKQDIEMSGKPLPVEKYLRRLLTKYVDTFTDYEESVDDYDGNWPALEQLSGVPDFIQGANGFVVKNRAVSVLVRQGSDKINASLKSAKADLSTMVNMLQSGVDEARARLEEYKKRLQQLKEDKGQFVSNIENAANEAVRKIEEHYKDRISKKLEENRDKLVQITRDNLPGTWSSLFKVKNKYKKKYREEIGALLFSILSSVRDEIRDGFTGLPSFITFRDSFEWNQREMQGKIEAFGQLMGVTRMEVHFPDAFAEDANGMVLGRAEELFEKAFDEIGTGIDWAWTILTLVIYKLFPTDRKRAEYIIKEFMPKYQDVVFDYLKKCMNQENPKGPLKVLNCAKEDFCRCFERNIQLIETSLHLQQSVLEDADNQACKLPDLKALIEKLEGLEAECRSIETGICRDFPA